MHARLKTATDLFLVPLGNDLPPSIVPVTPDIVTKFSRSPARDMQTDLEAMVLASFFRRTVR